MVTEIASRYFFVFIFVWELMKPKQEFMIRECFIPTGWLTNHRYTPTSGFYLALRAGWGCLFQDSGTPMYGNT